MSFIFNSKNRTLVVKITGELDLVTANELRERLDKAIDEMFTKNLFLDLTCVNFIDSSGLGVILGRYRKIQEKRGIMVLYGMNSNIKRILELSGILSIIPAFNSENEAWTFLERTSLKEA